MVTISLFDFKSPPDAISGEARALDSFDLLAFIPGGSSLQAGRKVTSALIKPSFSLWDDIGKLFFKPRNVLPTSKGLTTVTRIGSRGGGAPFKLSGGSARQSINYIAPNVAANTVKVSAFSFPKLIKPTIPKISGGTKILTGGALTLGGLGLLTQTPGGQNLTNETGETIQGITKFFSDNPLIVAGGVVILGVMMLK